MQCSHLRETPIDRILLTRTVRIFNKFKRFTVREMRRGTLFLLYSTRLLLHSGINEICGAPENFYSDLAKTNTDNPKKVSVLAEVWGAVKSMRGPFLLATKSWASNHWRWASYCNCERTYSLPYTEVPRKSRTDKKLVNLEHPTKTWTEQCDWSKH